MGTVDQDRDDSLVDDLNRQRAAERFLTEAARVLGQTRDLELAIAGIVQLAVPQFADWCLLDLLTQEGSEFDRVAVGHHSAGSEALAIKLKRRYPLSEENPVGVARAIAERRPLLAREITDAHLDRLATDDAHLQAARALRMRSSVVAPLLIDGKPIGALTLISSQRDYDGTDIWVAEQLAHNAAAAIETAQLLSAQLRISALVGSVREMAAKLEHAVTAEDVIQLTCKWGKEALGADSSVYWQVDPNGSLSLRTHSNAPAKLLSALRSLEADSPAFHLTDALRVDAPSWHMATAQESELFAELSSCPLCSYGVAPVVVEGNTAGVLFFLIMGRNPPDSAEQAFLVSVAKHCAQSLLRIQLIEREKLVRESERRSLERLELLAKAGESLASSLDLKETLSAVAKMIVPAVADWCSVDLVEQGLIQRVVTEHQDPVRAARAREHAARYQSRIGDEHGIARVIADRKLRFYARLPENLLVGAARDEQEKSYFRRESVISVIVVPLIVRDECIGALSLSTSDSGREYEHADALFAEELGRRAGTAIANARLYSELQEAHTRMRRVFAQAPMAISMYEGPEHRFVFANSLYLEGTRTSESIIGQRHADVFPGTKHVASLDQVYSSGEPLQMSELALTLRREEVDRPAFFDCSVVPVRNEQGQIEGLISASFDVTERVTTRLALETERADALHTKGRLALALQAANVGTWDFYPHSGELFWDERCRAIYGIAASAPLERTALFNLIHPEDRAAARDEIARSLAGTHDREFVLEYRILRASDGEVRSLISRGRVYFEDDRAVRMIGILTDITG